MENAVSKRPFSFDCTNKSRGLEESTVLPRVGCFGQGVPKEQGLTDTVTLLCR